MSVKVLGISGSLRAGSFNSMLVKCALEGARAAGAEATYADLRSFALPVFDEDLEKQGTPDGAKRLKELMKSHHAILIASPEYNSSVTAALKNAIDWATRPAAGEAPLAAFSGKVAGLLAASPGALGGLRGLVHLRAILGNIGVIVLPEQVAVMKAHEAFDAAGEIKDAKQRDTVRALGARAAAVAGKLLA
jgi:chromate reductase